MLISDVFPDGRSLMFFNTLIQVSACVADIVCIAQITLEMVNNALLVNNRGFTFFWLVDRSDLSACVHGMDIFSDVCDLILQVVFAQNSLISGPKW